MKRYIKSASNPIKDKYIKKIFDEGWEFGDETTESFVDNIDEGWRTGELDEGLREYCRDEGIELSELLDLAEQYGKYRESRGRSKYDTKGLDEFIESIISKYANLDINVEKKRGQTSYKVQEWEYIFSFDEYPRANSNVFIRLPANIKFEPSPDQENKVIRSIEYLQHLFLLADNFFKKYYNLVDTIYGRECLGLPSSKYKDYLSFSTCPEGLKVRFIYGSEYAVAKKLIKDYDYKKHGYIPTMLEALWPFFDYDGIKRIDSMGCLYCVVDESYLL